MTAPATRNADNTYAQEDALRDNDYDETPDGLVFDLPNAPSAIEALTRAITCPFGEEAE